MTADTLTDLILLRDRLGAIGGSSGMWLVLGEIYRTAGWTHALATLKGWGWTG